MNVTELGHLYGTVAGSMRVNREDSIWIKAFEEYDQDHPLQRPLSVDCRNCYTKVLYYLISKNKK